MTAPVLESANWFPVHQALVAGSYIFLNGTHGTFSLIHLYNQIPYRICYFIRFTDRIIDGKCGICFGRVKGAAYRTAVTEKHLLLSPDVNVGMPAEICRCMMICQAVPEVGLWLCDTINLLQFHYQCKGKHT